MEIGIFWCISQQKFIKLLKKAVDYTCHFWLFSHFYMLLQTNVIIIYFVRECRRA
jgi:hypothetical protein